MASISENSFGKRLDNAQALATHIESFGSYTELNAELSLETLNSKITELSNNNTEVATKLQSYSISVDTKQKIFTKEPNSIIKIVTPVIANVRSIFGKNSKEAQNISNLVTKIRGIKVAKPSVGATTETVSQSERSYGTILQTFSDLIATLETLGANYSPANAECSATKLKQKRDLASQINTKSIQDFGQLKIARESRIVKYEQLSALCQRFKETVKAQYGTQSTEYKLVKGLKI
ncbi:hypothetical protein [Flavobacterium sp.]|uniref:hypothetical protein n=1 Tax=Flavobacterium sp. TaxID=239 RepID=UPI00286DFA93|nr:hypothetical protein [Flavobacterium sp.]